MFTPLTMCEGTERERPTPVFEGAALPAVLDFHTYSIYSFSRSALSVRYFIDDDCSLREARDVSSNTPQSWAPIIETTVIRETGCGEPMHKLRRMLFYARFRFRATCGHTSKAARCYPSVSYGSF